MINSTFHPENSAPEWSVTACNCFSKEKETPLKLEERLGYMQAAFLKLGVDMFLLGKVNWLTGGSGFVLLKKCGVPK